MVLLITEKICDLLIKEEISSEEMKRAEKIFKEKGEQLSDILLRMNIVTREDYLAALSEVTGYAPINLSRVKIDRDIIKSIPERISRLYQVLPVSRIGNFLTVAMVDPSNVFALDDLRAVTKLEIAPVVADREDMREAIARYYERSADEEISEIVGDLSEAELELLEESKEDVSSGDLMRIMDETPVIKLTNLTLTQAVKEKASDVLIEPMEKNFRIRFRIDGVLHVRQTPPKKYLAPFISRLKVMSDLNIAERRLPQDGRFRLKAENRNIDFRVSILPSILGEKACLRVLDKGQVMVDVTKLGLKERDLNTIIQAAEQPNGLILACGPTGSGKTTTLYSVLKHVDSPEKNLVTVEDPVEYELKGINQVNVHADIGLTFAGSLRSILRQDPDVILIGEIRDYDTVDIAIKAALTGHLVLSTLHTNTASGSVVRLLNMGVEPFLISSSCLIFIAQRLIRHLCPECKEPYTPEKEAAQRYGLFDKNGKIATLYKGVGCSRCMNSGYRGRIAIVECLKVTPAIKELLFRGAEEGDIEKKAREEGMVSLRENGIENVIEGRTSLEEVLRVTTEMRKGT